MGDVEVKKEKAIIALGNAVTDIIVDIKEEDLVKLGLKKGQANYPEKISLESFLKTKRTIPGGSPSNVVVNSAWLGLKDRNGLIGTVGNDEIGKLYRKDLVVNRVLDYLTEIKGKSGVCYMLVTPDGERTSIIDLGVCGDYRIPFNNIDDFSIFHTTAYELATNEKKTMEALMHAYKNGLKVSFDLSDSGIVSRRRSLLSDIAKHTTILFANEHESKSLTGLEPEDSIGELSKMSEIAVVKLGKKGSLVKRVNGHLYKIPCYPANVLDVTGAGDAYAAAFLYGYFQGFDLEKCGNLASSFAAKICERYGARMRCFA